MARQTILGASIATLIAVGVAAPVMAQEAPRGQTRLDRAKNAFRAGLEAWRRGPAPEAQSASDQNYQGGSGRDWRNGSGNGYITPQSGGAATDVRNGRGGTYGGSARVADPRPVYKSGTGKTWDMTYTKKFGNFGQWQAVCYKTDAADRGSDGAIAFLPAGMRLDDGSFLRNATAVQVPLREWRAFEFFARHGTEGTRQGDTQAEQDLGIYGRNSERFQDRTQGPSQGAIISMPVMDGFDVDQRDGWASTDSEMRAAYSRIRIAMTNCYTPR